MRCGVVWCGVVVLVAPDSVLDTDRSGAVAASDVRSGLESLCGSALTLTDGQWTALCSALAVAPNNKQLLLYDKLISAVRVSARCCSHRHHHSLCSLFFC